MAKRTKREAEETREKIMDAAEQCFRDMGVSQTTLKMIAAKAGCTRGAIYWHFNEKNDLFKHVIERTPFLLFTDILSSNYSNKPIAALRQILLRGLQELENNKHLKNVIEVAVFRNERPVDNNHKATLRNEDMEKVFNLINNSFAQGKVCGEVKTDICNGILISLIFYVFIGTLKTSILVPTNFPLLDQSISALNLVFDIVSGQMEVCYEQ